MTNPQDFNAFLQDALKNMPLDTKAVEGAFKSSAAMGEDLSKVALTAAEKSAELSSKWAKDAFAKIGGLSTAQAAPEDIGAAVNDFASTSAQVASENLAAFAEIAQQVQKETLALFMAAGNDFGADAAEAVKTAAKTVKPAKK